MTYQHLSLAERYGIALYHQQGLGPTAIAMKLGRNKSTISRELRRNGVPSSEGYDAQRADQGARKRR